MHGWGGAQWVLVTWMTAALVLPLLLRAAGPRGEQSPTAWLGFYLSKAVDLVVLSLILLWGGFWNGCHAADHHAAR